MVFYKLPVLLLLLVFFHAANAQQLYLQHRRKKIKILTDSPAEAGTWNGDTIVTAKVTNPPFLVNRITHDSIELSQPAKWKDTFAYRFNFWTGRDRKDKKRNYKIPVQYHIKTFALKDISKLRYTYQHDQSGDGCVGCLLIPGLNIYYFWSKSDRTRIFDMTRWKFVWK